MSLYKIIAQDIDTLKNLVEYLEQNSNTSSAEVELALRKTTDIYNEILMLKPDGSDSFVQMNKPDRVSESVVLKQELKPEVKVEEQIKAEVKDKIKVKAKAVVEEPLVKTEMIQNKIEEEVKKEYPLTEHKVDVIEESLQETEDAQEPVFAEKEKAEEPEPEPEVLPETEEKVIVSEQENIEEVSMTVTEDILIEEEDEKAVYEEPVAKKKTIIENNTDKVSDGIKPGEVVADRFKNNTSVNDLLSSIVKDKDLATSIKDKPIKNLQKAIKVNDRIWYVKELFNSDADLYKEALEEIESKENLDSALSFIFDRFSWDQEKKSTVSFLELVFRRFAQNV